MTRRAGIFLQMAGELGTVSGCSSEQVPTDTSVNFLRSVTQHGMV